MRASFAVLSRELLWKRRSLDAVKDAVIETVGQGKTRLVVVEHVGTPTTVAKQREFAPYLTCYFEERGFRVSRTCSRGINEVETRIEWPRASKN